MTVISTPGLKLLSWFLAESYFSLSGLILPPLSVVETLLRAYIFDRSDLFIAALFLRPTTFCFELMFVDVTERPVLFLFALKFVRFADAVLT